MSWAAITTAEVLEEFTPAEKTKLEAVQGASNLEKILGRVVAQLRGAIMAGRYPVGAAGTVPEGQFGDIIAIARWKWLISLPAVSESLLSKEREKAHDDAQQRFMLIAQGELAVERPAEADITDEAAPGVLPSFGTVTKLLGQDAEEGV